MATLADLWRSLLPTARPVGPVAEESAAIAWVRVLKPRVPAFDALDPGDLAIVPSAALAVVAPTRDDLATLVAALAGAPASGVVIATDPESAEAGELLVTALAEARLPALVAAVDPASLERQAIGFLVNRRAELDRQAADLERQIERLALAGRGADDLAAAIGAFLGRAVVIERRRGEPLAIHAPADRPADAALVARYHARPAAVPLRVSLPGGDGRPAGALVLLGDGVGERERVVCDRISTLLALELSRVAPGAGTFGGRADALPAAGPPWVVLVARQDAEGPTPASLERREELRREVRLVAAGDRLALRGGPESLELRAVAAALPDDPLGHLLAARIGAILERTVAVSQPFAEVSGRPLAEADARATLEAAERLPDPPAVARADRLAAYRLLGGLPGLPDGLRQARLLLDPLLVGGPAARRRRLDTLRAVLDREIGVGAAAALGVHRNTVAYRMRRMEQLAGWDLRDPDLRLALAVAVRIVQDAQSSESPS